MTSEEFADQIWNAVMARADDLVVFSAQLEGIDLTESERMLIEAGISAGMAATLEELQSRGLLVTL